MDDIDRDIAKARIGKRDETLVNPYKPKQTEKQFYLPPMNVKHTKPLSSSYTTASDSNDGVWLSLLVMAFLAIIFGWILGMMFGFW